MNLNTVRRLTPVKGVGVKARKTARFLRRPLLAIEHRTAMGRLDRRDDLTGLVDERRGYGMLPAGLLPGAEETARFCRELLEERRDRPDLWPVPPRKYKDYPLPIMRPREPLDAPPVFDLVMSDPVLQIASDYLGEVPVLENINIWWTPRNDEMRGSQFYHRDTLSWSERQAKFVVNLIDIDEDAGPFTFLPADVSDAIVRHHGVPPERLSDDVIFETAAREDQVSVVGPAGTTCMVDSSRCFHQGSRCRGKERLVLVFHFRPYLSPDRSHKVRPVSAAYAQDLATDPVRRIVYPVAARQ